MVPAPWPPPLLSLHLSPAFSAPETQFSGNLFFLFSLLIILCPLASQDTLLVVWYHINVTSWVLPCHPNHPSSYWNCPQSRYHHLFHWSLLSDLAPHWIVSEAHVSHQIRRCFHCFLPNIYNIAADIIETPQTFIKYMDVNDDNKIHTYTLDQRESSVLVILQLLFFSWPALVQGWLPHLHYPGPLGDCPLLLQEMRGQENRGWGQFSCSLDSPSLRLGDITSLPSLQAQKLKQSFKC